MFSELIKDKADSWYGYMGSSFMQGIDEWCELRTSKVTDENKPWRFSIPLDLLSLSIEKVDAPRFMYKGNGCDVFIHKVPLLRKYNLTSNISELDYSEQVHTKELLEKFINENYTHIYQVIEERQQSMIEGRVMNEVMYIVRGTKIGY
jgi:hypothetical protein